MLAREDLTERVGEIYFPHTLATSRTRGNLIVGGGRLHRGGDHRRRRREEKEEMSFVNYWAMGESF